MTVVADTADLACPNSEWDESPSHSPTKTIHSPDKEIRQAKRSLQPSFGNTAFDTEQAMLGDPTYLQIATDFLAGGRPKVVIDRERRVLCANHAATTLLRMPLPVSIRKGVLAFDGANDPLTCHEWLGRAVPRPQRFLVVGSEPSLWVVLQAYSRRLNGEELVVTEFILSQPPLRAADNGMSVQFGLTPAECEVIDALVRLEGPSEIAARLGVSINTVRTHMRRLFAKLAVNSQVQLVRIAAAFGAG